MWSQVRQKLWEWRGVVMAVPTVTVAVVLLRGLGILQAAEWTAFDQYMQWRPAERVDDRIVIVGIDEADLAWLGQGVISDQVLADLLNRLKAQNPRAIGLDIYRNLPEEPGYAALVEVFETTPNLVGIQKVVGEAGRDTVAPPPVLSALGQVGANDLVVDADNTIRRGLISVDSAAGETVYSFSLYLALLYLESEGIGPEPIDGSENWRLGQATVQLFNTNDGGYIRADARGNQVLLNYRGGQGAFPVVSLTDVLSDRLPADWGRDRVILIGGVGESFQDTWFTPYSSTLLSLPEPMAGVEIHAHLVSQLLSAAETDRPLFQSWAEWVEWTWIVLWILAGATFTWQLRQGEQGLRQTARKIVTPLLGLGILLGSTYGLFLAGWWVPVVPPLVGAVGATVTVTSYLAYTAGRIRKIFGRYLNDEVVTNLLDNPQSLSLGGERRTVTILTSDLRGFTALTDKLSPEEVIKVINFYMEHMSDVITQYQGTICDLAGDGILVLFGAPTLRQDDPLRAIACAIAMQKAMAPVNETITAWGFPALEMGIGINTGGVVVGNIGSEKHTEYGVMGSHVNLAYRIESYTTGGEVLLSAATLAAADKTVQVGPMRTVNPKGFQQAVTIHTLQGIGGDHDLWLSQGSEAFVALRPPIGVQYAIVNDKQVSTECFNGQLTHLSEKGAMLRMAVSGNDSNLSNLVNVKLNLLREGALVSEDFYAKILEAPAGMTGVYLRFTAVPDGVRAQFSQYD